MSKVVTTTVLPRDGFDTLNIGATGDTVAIAGDSLNTNVLQDAGGNNIFTSSSGTVSSTALQGSLKLLSTQTASNSASVSFTTQLTSTYDVYCFKFIEINPATDSTNFQMEGSTGSFGVTKTTTAFSAYHYESDSGAALGYEAGHDLAQSTSAQPLSGSIGNGSDENASGELYLYAPSSTTYVKQFYSKLNLYGADNHSGNWFISGYYNTASAISGIRFSMSSGNFDGTIKLYGISKT